VSTRGPVTTHGHHGNLFDAFDRTIRRVVLLRLPRRTRSRPKTRLGRMMCRITDTPGSAEGEPGQVSLAYGLARFVVRMRRRTRGTGRTVTCAARRLVSAWSSVRGSGSSCTAPERDVGDVIPDDAASVVPLRAPGTPVDVE
jgi:hypothetical protein